MKTYAMLAGGIAAFVLITFLIIEALGVPLLTDPSDAIREGGLLAGSIGLILLLLDVFIPIPASVIMITHGAVYGIVLGSLISLIGGVGATLLGFAVGQRGARYIERQIPERERERAKRLLTRWGLIALIVSRPVPIFSETVAVMAGTTKLTWLQVTVASVVGTLPAAVIYAIAGTITTDVASGLLVVVLVVVLAGVFWAIARRFEHRLIQEADQADSASSPS